MGRIKVGVIGGSFNPPTIGHIQLTNLCSQYLDRIWIMPCYKHLNKPNLIDDEHRINMLKSIKFNGRNIGISNFEILSKSSGRTYDTICNLNEQYHDIEFYIILGSDNINNIKTFFNYEKLIEENNFCIVERKGYITENIELFNSNPKNIFIGDNDILEISSSEIRNNVNNSEYCSKYLTSETYQYILDNHLYN